MNDYKLIYFKGCPNYQPAVSLLECLGIVFEEICQDDLDVRSPLKGYSSPTLLRGEQIVFGSKAKGGGCSFGLPSEKELKKLIKE